MRNQHNNDDGLNLDPELSFIGEFELSRNGMIEEVKTEFNIVRLCMTEADNLGNEYLKMIDRILVMPIRKLLCEKNSVLLKISPDFKMSPLTGSIYELDGKLHITRPSFEVLAREKWIPLNDWLQKDIAYFDRTVDDLPDVFPEFVYLGIINKLKKADRQDFESLLQRRELEYKGKPSVVYLKKKPKDIDANKKIFSCLEAVGYNHLSIYNFLKHQSDKRGAHIDVGHSLVVEMINNPIEKNVTITLCIAIQMVYAAKVQIPELSDYWPNMPTLETN